jgi:FkbM family methyltransferase
VSDHDPTYRRKLNDLVAMTGRERRVFLDVGGNRGDFTAQLLEDFPGSRVHAVEPDPQLCAGLRERFASRDVTLWNAALHDHEGTLELQVHANPGTSSLLERPANARRYFDSGDRVVAKVPVRAMTLDRLAEEAGIGRVDLMKLDTQGAELPILRGGRRLLAAAAIDVIYTEFFLVPHYEGAATLRELWDELAAHGYGMYDLFKGPHGRNGQLRFGDAIFVSPRMRAEFLDTFPDEA